MATSTLAPPSTLRREASAFTLARRAAGPCRTWPGKVWRLLVGLWTYLTFRGVDERLARLAALGHIETIPTRVQLFVGGYDMLRFWISPAADDYYRQCGISYGFHQLLRFLDEPVSVTDPLGFLSTRDGIIGHLLQVVHANPHYDLQLLDGFDDGLDQLIEQTEQMLAGTHPRAATIAAIVEEPDYHERLLAYARAYRADPSAPPPVRINVATDPRWATLEATFGTLTGAMRYFATLPTTVGGGLRHVRTVDRFVGGGPESPRPGSTG